MFKENRETTKFQWADLGDLVEGRPNLGLTMPVLVYRLFQFTMRDVLITECGVEITNRIFWRSGWEAGRAFAANLLDLALPFPLFVAQLQQKLKDMNIGIMRIERTDLERLEFTLTVAEDLDCSGLPISDEVVCTYDEGFLAGILEQYTGKPFDVREIDCWASGGRTCRFHAKAK
jgi:predicted hydrocarbon binding protein